MDDRALCLGHAAAWREIRAPTDPNKILLLSFSLPVLALREVRDAVRARLAEDHYGAILVDTRELAAELLYYLRDDPAPLYVWPSGPLPSHHYELTRPFTAATSEPILYVSLRRYSGRLEGGFGTADFLGMQRVTLVEDEARVLHFCRLAGYTPLVAPNAP